MQSSADKINESLNRFENEIEIFFDKFDGSIFRTNFAINRIQQLIGASGYQVFIPNKKSLIKYPYSVGLAKDDDIDFWNVILFLHVSSMAKYQS